MFFVFDINYVYELLFEFKREALNRSTFFLTIQDHGKIINIHLEYD
jgi:hypothetical protein